MRVRPASVVTCVAAVLFVPAAAAAQSCLHGPDAPAEQKTRQRAAVTAARQIHALQASSPGRRDKKYLDRNELAAAAATHAERCRTRYR